MLNKINIFIFFIICIIFFISGNIAWLNPRPDFYVYRTVDFFPLFWQYNVDSSMELLSAAYFPDYFEINGIRVSRPGYPILVKIISLPIYYFVNIFYPLSILISSGIAYLILKFITYLISAILLYKLLLFYFNKTVAITSIFITYFHYHSIFYATTFHTSELAFIIPIIVCYLFNSLLINYSLKKNIYFSIIVGSLMLCRPDYAIYSTLLLFCFTRGYFKETITSFCFHLIPIFFYIIYLNIIQIEFNHYGVQNAGYFTWFLDEIKGRNLIFSFIVVLKTFYKYFLNLISYYTIFFLFFIYSLIFLRRKFDFNLIYFTILYFFFVWLQTFVTNRWGWGGYMVADLTILIIPLSVIGLYDYLSKIINIKKFDKFLIGLYCVLMIISFIHLPWKHPYDQNNQLYDKNEFDILEIR